MLTNDHLSKDTKEDQDRGSGEVQCKEAEILKKKESVTKKEPI